MIFLEPWLYVLLAALVVAVRLLPGRWRTCAVTAAGAGLLGWFSPVTLAVFAGAAILTHFAAWSVAAAKSKATASRWAWASSAILVAAVVSARVFLPQMFGGLEVSVSGVAAEAFKVIGVAFVAARIHGYLHSVLYDPSARLSVWGLFGYLLYLPTLTGGPLIRLREWREMSGLQPGPSLSTDAATDIECGTRRILWGLAKKVLTVPLLMWLATATENKFAGSSGTTWLAARCAQAAIAVFVVYFDFSGYSDIAIGVARLLGHRIRENFSVPFLATSMTHFWRGWHVTMGDWLREHLFIPLGGLKAGKWKVILITLAIMLFSGLWHAFELRFLLWGAYHGVLLSAERLFEVRPLPPQSPSWKLWMRRSLVFIAMCGSASFFIREWW
jgi:alginate O-acetyltransferase complex protein AlgI